MCKILTTICELLHMYWRTPVDFEVMEETLKGNKWIGPKVLTKKHEEGAIEWIAHQYPAGVKKSPYVTEFVILDHSLNMRKEHLWASNSLSQHLKWSDSKPSQGNKQNGKTMQFNLQYNKWWDDVDKIMKDATQNKGKCQAIKKFRDIIGVYKYHQFKEIEEIMVAQIKRIGDAFELMETKVLLSTTIPDGKGGTRAKYVSRDLKTKWEKFMKEAFDHRIQKIEDWMETWAKVIKKMSEGNPSSELGIMFRRATNANKPQDMCKVATDQEVLYRMKLALRAYENRGKWKNPIDWVK